MMKHKFRPDWADLGARMKWMTTVVLGASAFLGACATQATGGEPRGVDERQEIIVTSDVGTTRVVRMVIETDSDDDGAETTRMCVFVPAGDVAGGALSCSGDDVRVFEFGSGQQFVMGDSVVDGEEIRLLIEERLATVNERLSEEGDLHIEFIEEFENSAEFRADMRELQEEMSELHRELRFEFRDFEGMSDEERAEFDAEMAEFQIEMREFEGEMAGLQAEVMAEVVGAMADRSEGDHRMRWFGDDDQMSRNIIRIEQNGVEHITIIERNEDDDGNPTLVIRTTDPGSVEVIQIEPDELREELDDD